VAKDMISYRNFIIDSLMQNASISFVETSMVIGVDKRTVYVPIHEDDEINQKKI
jgi:hypothetical protein